MPTAQSRSAGATRGTRRRGGTRRVPNTRSSRITRNDGNLSQPLLGRPASPLRNEEWPDDVFYPETLTGQITPTNRTELLDALNRDRNSVDESLDDVSRPDASVASGDVHDPTKLMHVTKTTGNDSQYVLNLDLLGPGWHEAEHTSREVWSKIWDHGFAVQYGDKKWWLCKICHTKYGSTKKFQLTHKFSAATTSNQWAHMLKVHRISKTGPLPALTSIFGSFSSSTATPRSTTSFVLASRFPITDFKAAFIEWVVCDNITLRQSVSKRFHQLVTLCNIEAAKALRTSPNTSRSWIISAFEKEQQTIREAFITAKSRISISFDGWQSDDGRNFLGICSHFIDHLFVPRTILLGLPRILGEKSGVGQAAHITPVLSQWGITASNLGWFVLDNATNNDTTLEHLSGPFSFTVKERRLRCAGHIINLVAESFLYGADPAGMMTLLQTTEHTDEICTLWRKRGPIGKLHNIVYHITRSTKRAEALATLQKEETDKWSLTDGVTDKVYALVRDGGVRWNSAYMMTERAISIKRSIDTFCMESDHNVITADTLSQGDWTDLIKIKEILQPLFLITKDLEECAGEEKHEGLLYQVVLELYGIYTHLRDCYVQYEHAPADNHIKVCLESAVRTLKKWLQAITQSPAWTAAVVLHPRYKWGPFEEIHNMDSQGFRELKRAVQELWERDYKLTAAEAAARTPPTKKRRFEHSAFHSVIFPAPDAFQDDYQKYISEKRDDIDDPVQWWKEHERTFPHLSKLAFDMLAIPAMSTECERIFSKAGYALRPRRSRLGADILQAGECLKSWITRGLVRLYKPRNTQEVDFEADQDTL